MNERRLAALFVLFGAALVALGFAVIYPPAGVIALGMTVAAVGIEARRRA